jgi:hypothetical protein
LGVNVSAPPILIRALTGSSPPGEIVPYGTRIQKPAAVAAKITMTAPSATHHQRETRLRAGGAPGSESVAGGGGGGGGGEDAEPRAGAACSSVTFVQFCVGSAE